MLTHYKKVFEKSLEKALLEMGEDNELKRACAYSLTNGGKRFRPILVYLIAEALGKGYDVTDSALAVEYFHTASLLADDLPCMDNDAMRRNKPSTHLVFNEATALLGSYTLISSGYESLYTNAKKLAQQGVKNSDEICVEALKVVTRCAGIFGATKGQFLDLFPSDHTIETALEIIHLKTGTLFEITFSLGWLFGGGEITSLPLVRQCAYHFGLAFQTADDLQDALQDKEQKTTTNIAALLGIERALSLFEKETELLEEKLKKLNLWNEGFQEIFHRLIDLAKID